MTTARGIRNNNPGNLRHSTDQWLGKSPNQTDPEFIQFERMEDGIRAMVLTLVTYMRKHRLTTVREIIGRWAPKADNNDTDAYVDAVCDGWVRPDEQLPDTRATYLFLAQRIARHENGWKDYQTITPAQWEGGLAAAGFPDVLNRPETAKSGPPLGDPPPVATTPLPKEKTMPVALPWILTAAQSLFPLVADLFRGHGGGTATRNAEILDKVAAPIVEIAKTVTGATGEQQAAQAVLDDPAVQVRFRDAVAADMDRLMGMVARGVQIDDDSRDRAAKRAAAGKDYAFYLIQRQFWMLAGMAIATLVAMIGAVVMKAPNEIIVGLLVLFTGLANEAKTNWKTMVEFRFGSSAGSQAKDEILAQMRR